MIVDSLTPARCKYICKHEGRGVRKEVLAHLLSEHGVCLLRFLRSAYCQEEGLGKRIELSSHEMEEMTNLADSLGLIDGGQLSPQGYTIGGFAKEYLPWLDGGKTLGEESGIPDEMVHGKKILDVGFGAGRYLVDFTRRGAAECFGIEVQPELVDLVPAMLFEREGLPAPVLKVGRAEAIPFADGKFDVVFCRLVLSYTQIKLGLSEFFRVLSPGGHFVLIYATLRVAVRQMLQTSPTRPRKIVWYLWGIMNTGLLQITRRQLSMRKRERGRFRESQGRDSTAFPTTRWLSRTLQECGFTCISNGSRMGVARFTTRKK